MPNGLTYVWNTKKPNKRSRESQNYDTDHRTEAYSERGRGEGMGEIEGIG